MLSLLAGDRAGLRYGTKRIVVFGGAWWNCWMLIISLLVNGREDVNDCLKLASMGGMLALGNLPQLLLSVHMTPTVAMALVTISGGSFNSLYVPTSQPRCQRPALNWY
ncbi:hypothetical protein CNMCM6106_007677 [Aspergillus hiratsukae]|uniref:Uncharacterized protein n=1 Tax=Aspergillus hiratsukae TaxID=1194566 RepID=A0A8H6PT41_9EURO|nr:hypothetical protein CNMCM6106_007677 [Aspergillus hiratsukae]